jgi:signal transduction histidine kinase
MQAMPQTDTRLRLVAVFALLIAVLGIVGWQGAGHLRRLNAQTQEIFSEHWQKSKTTREAFRLSNLNNRITMLVFMLEDENEIQRLLIERAANTERISALVGLLDVSLDQPEEKRLLAAVKTRRAPYVDTYKRALALLTEGKRDEARRIMTQETLPLLVAYHDAWNDFYQYQSDEVVTAMVKNKADFTVGQRQFLVMVGLAGLITLAIAGFTVWLTGREIAERKQAHKQLLETSRQVGRAEVATSVLHNVGNVLNSVNIAASCVADSLRKSKAANLSKVVGMLQKHEADLGTFLTLDPKGKQLPGYLAQLTEHLSGEQAAALKELAHLQKNIEHIMDIVNMQQSFAKVSGLLETLQLTDLVDDALKMNASSFARHDIKVIKEFKPVPPVSVEKHNVLQILVNLVRNAKDACDNSGRSDKQLTLRVSNGQERVRIAVTDNGIGIPAENLTRIFSHGFTTRKDGHGFGLHSGALAAKEMGGVLTVQSEGPNRGATFTLELPLIPPRRNTGRAGETPQLVGAPL